MSGLELNNTKVPEDKAAPTETKATTWLTVTSFGIKMGVNFMVPGAMSRPEVVKPPLYEG